MSIYSPPTSSCRPRKTSQSSGTQWRLGCGASLLERFVWGKSFAGGRCHDISTPKRLIFAVLSPVIPFLFCWRLAAARGRGGRFATVLLAFFTLQCCWALGELAGYGTGKP